MMHSLKSLITAAAATTLAVGCVTNDAPSAVSAAIPTADQVALKLPASAAAGMDKAVGQVSDYYVATRDVTQVLNGGTAFVLVLLHTIVQQPPTSVSGNVYTWGPGSSALDPATYKLVVTANPDGTFDYVLSGESKITPGAGFLPLITGHADPSGDNTGNFDLSFDDIHTVDPVDNPNAAGNVTIDYDLANQAIELSLSGVMINAQPETASYAYQANPDGSGQMTFDVHESLNGDPAIEELTLRSRWLADGEGRGDARITGGELGTTQVLATECWNAMFIETFYTDNQNWQPTAGDATTCAFADQDLPPAN
jgi:hypothetical protein